MASSAAAGGKGHLAASSAVTAGAVTDGLDLGKLPQSPQVPPESLYITSL